MLIKCLILRKSSRFNFSGIEDEVYCTNSYLYFIRRNACHFVSCNSKIFNKFTDRLSENFLSKKVWSNSLSFLHSSISKSRTDCYFEKRGWKKYSGINWELLWGKQMILKRRFLYRHIKGSPICPEFGHRSICHRRIPICPLSVFIKLIFCPIVREKNLQWFLKADKCPRIINLGHGDYC